MRRPHLACSLGLLLWSPLVACTTSPTPGAGGEQAPQAAVSAPAPADAGAPAKAMNTGPSPLSTLSPVPEPAEWAADREVTVKGSSALGCETKMVREWLRVSCRGKNDTGGDPITVVVRRGAGPNVFTFKGTHVTSLVMPFVEGVDLEATFSWTDKEQKLTARWPRKAPKPAVIAVFEAAS